MIPNISSKRPGCSVPMLAESFFQVQKNNLSVSATTFIGPYAESKDITHKEENAILSQNHSSGFPLPFPETCQAPTTIAFECQTFTSSPKSTYLQNILRTTNKLTHSSTPTIQRCRPGRPRNVKNINQIRNTDTSAVKTRRKKQNESALRSRARLNKALDDLWRIVPEQDQDFYLKNRVDNKMDACRADKLEVVVTHMKSLQAQLRTHSRFSQSFMQGSDRLMIYSQVLL
jgi:hypothetical protein